MLKYIFVDFENGKTHCNRDRSILFGHPSTTSLRTWCIVCKLFIVMNAKQQLINQSIMRY